MISVCTVLFSSLHTYVSPACLLHVHCTEAACSVLPITAVCQSCANVCTLRVMSCHATYSYVHDYAIIEWFKYNYYIDIRLQLDNNVVQTS